HLLDRALHLALCRLTVSTAQSGKARGMIGAAATVARQKIYLIDRYIEAIFAEILDGKVFAGLLVVSDALDADKLTDAVLDMHNVVVDFEIGKAGKALVVLFGDRAAIDRRLFLHAEKLAVGDRDQPDIFQFKAGGKPLPGNPD